MRLTLTATVRNHASGLSSRSKVRWCWTARAYSSATRADHEGHATATAQLTQITTELGGNRFWSKIATWWTPAPQTPSVPEPDSGSNSSSFDDIDWIDGSDAARQRWTVVGSVGGQP